MITNLLRWLRNGIALVLVLSPASAFQSDVFTVAPSGTPGVDFTAIQLAIDTVPDGSTLLIALGQYPAVVIDGKSLTLIADSPSPSLLPTFWSANGGPNTSLIVNLASNQDVSLQGLQFLGDGGLHVDGVQGRVWIQDCDIRGSFESGLLVDGMSRAVVVNSELVGGKQAPGFPALEIRNAARVQTFGSLIRGATPGIGLGGVCNGFPGPGFGIHGNSRLLARDCTLRGGFCGGIFPGGVTAVESTGSARIALHNCLVETTVDAPDFELPALTQLSQVDDLTRSIATDPLMIQGVSYTIELVGAPQDLALVFTGSRQGNQVGLNLLASLSLDAPIFLTDVMTLDASGAAAYSIIPTLPAGMSSSRAFAQVLHVATSGAFSIGSPAAVTVIQ